MGQIVEASLLCDVQLAAGRWLPVALCCCAQGAGATWATAHGGPEAVARVTPGLMCSSNTEFEPTADTVSVNAP